METSVQQTLGKMLLLETYLLSFIRMLRPYYVERRNWT